MRTGVDARSRARSRYQYEHTSLATSGGKHVLVDRFEAEFVAAEAANRDAAHVLRLASLPDSGWVSEMHGDLASLLGDDQMQLQAADAAVDQQLLAAAGGLRALSTWMSA